MQHNFHQQVKQVFGVEVVAVRPDDSLPCHLCGSEGPIVVVKLANGMFDFCMNCAGRFGLLSGSA